MSELASARFELRVPVAEEGIVNEELVASLEELAVAVAVRHEMGQESPVTIYTADVVTPAEFGVKIKRLALDAGADYTAWWAIAGMAL